MNITGQLIGPEGSKLSFADCRVEALFDRIVEASSSGTTPAGATSDLRPATATQALAVSVSPTDGGAFTFEITEVEAIVAKRIELVVYSPAGKRIGGMELQVADGDLALEVPVDSFGPADLVSPEDARRRVQGRVIERNGKELPARFQVLILARDLNNNATAGQPANRDVPNADAGEEAAGAENHTKSVVTYPGTPVLVATVDRSGYFAGEVPPTKFESAIAVVEGFADSYPISLDSSLIPTTIPIVVEIASKQLAPGDCDCGSESTRDLSGRCVSVNQPNKAIEEFNFYTVVRTTEPEILAREIGKIIDPPVDSGVRPEIPGPTISVSVEDTKRGHSLGGFGVRRLWQDSVLGGSGGGNSRCHRRGRWTSPSAKLL